VTSDNTNYCTGHRPRRAKTKSEWRALRKQSQTSTSTPLPLWDTYSGLRALITLVRELTSHITTYLLILIASSAILAVTLLPKATFQVPEVVRIAYGTGALHLCNVALCTRREALPTSLFVRRTVLQPGRFTRHSGWPV
jgi:hypothetical protein